MHIDIFYLSHRIGDDGGVVDWIRHIDIGGIVHIDIRSIVHYRGVVYGIWGIDIGGIMHRIGHFHIGSIMNNGCIINMNIRSVMYKYCIKT